MDFREFSNGCFAIAKANENCDLVHRRTVVGQVSLMPCLLAMKLLKILDQLEATRAGIETFTSSSVDERIEKGKERIIEACSRFRQKDARRLAAILENERAMLADKIGETSIQHADDSVLLLRYTFEEKCKREFELANNRPYNPRMEAKAMRIAYDRNYPGDKRSKARDFQNARAYAKRIGFTGGK